jgi:hypothetical protein
MHRSWILLAIGIVLAGCREPAPAGPSRDDVRRSRFGAHGEFLKAADSLEIHSLASRGGRRNGLPPGTKQFRGWEILGSTTVKERERVRSVWADLYRRVDSRSAEIYNYCFLPRHGIRAVKGQQTKDYVICFECDHIYVYAGPDEEEYDRVGMEAVAEEPVLNGILDRAGIRREVPDSTGGEK